MHPTKCRYYHLLTGILIASLMLSVNLIGQCTDVITNGGFEDVNTCLTSGFNGNGCAAGDWVGSGFDNEGVAQPWIQVTYGSVDTWNSCYNPDGDFWDTPPHGGDGYLAFYPYTYVPSPGWAEYFQQSLVTPLEAGQQYCLRFYTRTNGENSEDVDQIELIVSQAAVTSPTPNTFGPLTTYTPDFTYDFTPGQAPGWGEWIEVEYIFVADGGEQWLTFGRFSPIIINSNASEAYLHIDDISLVEVNPIVVEVEPSCPSCTGSAAVQFPGDYNWYDNNFELIANDVDNIANLCAGNYMVECGCQQTFFDIIDADNCILTTEIPDQTLCVGDTIVMTAITSGGQAPYSYSWSPQGIEQMDNTLSVSPTNTTIYNLTVTDSQGDTFTDQATITVIPVPIFDLGPDIFLCSGTALLDAGNIGTSYIWQDNSVNQTLVAASSGSFWVQVMMDGCTSIDSVDVTIGAVQVDLGEDIFTCNPFQVLSTEIIGAQYLWQNGETNPSFNTNDYGTYWVEVSIENCSDSDTIQVLESEALASFYTNSPIGCDQVEVSFFNQSYSEGGLVDTWLWNFGDGQESLEASPTHTYFQSGDYEVTLHVQSDNECSADTIVTVEVEVIPSPIADFQFSPEEIELLDIVQFTDLSIGASEWQWDFGNGEFSNEQDPSHFYIAPGTYEVSLTVNNEGCMHTISGLIRIDVDADLYVPNSFTPDNDGVNDLFIPIFSDPKYILDYRFEIWNRWGNKIFESQELGRGWNGSYFGNEWYAKDGIYTWVVEYRIDNHSEKKRLMGSVNIMR